VDGFCGSLSRKYSNQNDRKQLWLRFSRLAVTTILSITSIPYWNECPFGQKWRVRSDAESPDQIGGNSRGGGRLQNIMRLALAIVSILAIISGLLTPIPVIETIIVRQLTRLVVCSTSLPQTILASSENQ
jgi:hypothetical protein